MMGTPASQGTVMQQPEQAAGHRSQRVDRMRIFSRAPRGAGRNVKLADMFIK
jgi:hypothetical protein